MIEKSKRLIDDVHGGIFSVNEMNAAAIAHTFTMTNLFVCIEQQLHQIVTMYEDLSEFPIHAFFLRDLPEFDQSLKESECLGGTMSFLEGEMRNQLVHFRNIKLKPH